MSDETGTSGEEQTPFKYVLGEKEDVIVVLFSGKMSSSDSAIFDKCGAELAVKNQIVILMAFNEVEQAAIGVFSSFAKFQKVLRDQGKHLGLCGINAVLKAQLQASGIIREIELFPNVPAAWQALKAKAKNPTIENNSENQNGVGEKKSAA